MNILFYFDHQINPERGGTERVSDLLAHLFRSESCEVYYLAKFQEYPVGDVDTFFLPDKENRTSEKNIRFIEELVRKLHIDYIINQGTNGDDIYLMNHAVLHIPSKIISCLHFSVYEGLDYFRELLPLNFDITRPKSFVADCARWLKQPYNKHRALCDKRKRFRFIYQHSDAVVVLASKYKEHYKEVARLQEDEKLFVIPNPVTFSTVELPDKKQNEIVFVGRLSFAEKRVDRILKAWKRAYGSFPDWRLSIVGDGPDRLRLEELTRTMKLENVTFYGFQSPEPFYRRAKVFCMTSTHEGLPMVLLEAMQYGVVPVVYNSFGAAGDILQNGKCGMLVKPFDEEAYAKALVRLMQDEELRMRYAKEAVSSLTGYQPEGISGYWRRLFEKLNKE